MHTFTEENYLKAIYKLTEKAESEANTNAIAERLNTKAGTVTDMLKKLAEKELINYKKYQGVTLTDKGARVAISIIRKHRLWEYFLVDKLDYSWDEIHNIAEELEHIGSVDLVDRLDKFLNYPKFDPHGDPIPDSNGRFHHQQSQQLSDTEINSPVIMIGVIDHSPAFLQYLNKIGLQLGADILIHEAFVFDKSLQIQLQKGTVLHISHEVAKNILVSKK